MNRLVITYILFIALYGISFSQGILEITSDRDSYSYGDSIIVTTTIFNNTDTTFSIFGSYSCLTKIKFNDVNFNIACTTMETEFIFDPGTSWNWEWIIDPYRLGIPKQEGLQIIYGFTESQKDSITIEAPLFYGGQILVGFSTDLPEEEINNIKDSLDVIVLDSDTSETSNRISERWQILSIKIDSVITEYEDDPRFRYIVADDILNHTALYTTDIQGEDSPPTGFKLFRNYPNPFNPSTRIKFQLNKPAHVTLLVFNTSGQLVKKLIDEPKSAGNHEIVYLPNNIASGVYYYKIIAGNYINSGKMVYIK